MKTKFKLGAIFIVLLTLSSCYNDEIDQLNSELDLLNAQVDDLQTQLNALANVNTEIAALENTLTTFTTTYEVDQAEVATLQTLVNDLSTLANTQGADLDAIAVELEEVQSLLESSLEGPIASLEAFLASYYVPENFLFEQVAEVSLGGANVTEIGAFDKETNQLFLTNPETGSVEVMDLTNPNQPILKDPIVVGELQSVAVSHGKLAIAVGADDNATTKGQIIIYNTTDLTTPYATIEAGYLPDMVKFTPDGNYVLSADEGEPNDNYDVDPVGSVTIVDVAAKTAQSLTFEAFNGQEATLEQGHFRVFGPNATLAQDVEPEYIAIAADSKTAYVALQENNGLAVVDIASKAITGILPLGVKDYSLPENRMDFSDRDGIVGNLTNYNVKSYFMPDAIDMMEINGTEYIFSANEGDARDYDGYSEEDRVDDLTLDPTVYPNAATLQLDENLGRLKTTTAYGDLDGDGDVDQIFGYGARSFSIWGTDGSLVYDSFNTLTTLTLGLGTYPDGRSDDKGSEPESVVAFKSNGNAYIAVGLERSGDVLIFDVSTPTAPIFIQHLPNSSPEGLVVVKAQDSPTGKTLLIVANEHPDGAPISIYTK